MCFADTSLADMLFFPEGILLMFKRLMPSLAFALLLICGYDVGTRKVSNAHTSHVVLDCLHIATA